MKPDAVIDLFTKCLTCLYSFISMNFLFKFACQIIFCNFQLEYDNKMIST